MEARPWTAEGLFAPLRVAVAGALFVGLADFGAALGPARRAGVGVDELGLQIATLVLVLGTVLGLIEWIAMIATRALELRFALGAGGRVWLYAAWLSALPSVLWATLLASRWAAIGWAARIAMLVGLVAAQLVAHASVRALVRWRREPGTRSRATRLALALLAVGSFGLLYAADRAVLPRLYRPMHDGLAVVTCYAAQAVALALGDLVPSPFRSRYGRAAWALVLIAILLPGARPASRIGRDPSLAFVLLERTNVVGRVIALARARFDRDRDGHSAILGGGDCDDRDDRVHPGALDLPENGVDEDCSGTDLRLEELGAPGVQSPSPVRGRFDVLLVTVDALRADHLGAHGYARRTSPELDRLAGRARFFQRAYAQSNNTAASIPSLHTGRYPSTSPWSFDHPKSMGPGWAYLTDEANVTLAELLRDAGWSTALFAGRGPLLELGLGQGFQTTRTKLEDQADALIAHVEALGDERWFAWLHFDEPHAPYEAHPGFDFGSSNLDRYDSEIARVDQRIGRILAWLARTGRDRTTLVVVTADHGEELGDHGGEQHASTLYEEQIHVPLVVSVPGVAPRSVPEPVQLVDVVPTILSVLGIAVPELADGRSLLSEGRRDARAYSEHYNGTVLARALVTERHKLISNTQSGTLELYDLEADPRERENVVGRERALAGSLRRELDTLSERRTLLALAQARRHGGPSLDTLARALRLVERPELLVEAANVLATAAEREPKPTQDARDAWALEVSQLLRRPGPKTGERANLVRSLERIGGVWALRGLIWSAGGQDEGVVAPALAGVERVGRTAPHPYKWPPRAERAPEVSHLDFGSRHGDWQVVSGMGDSERVGIQSTAWSSGDRTRVAFWIPFPGPRTDDWVLEAVGWAHPDAPELRVRVGVHINGQARGELAFGKDLSRAALVVPSGALRAGPNFVDFVYPATFGPKKRALRWDFAMLFPALPVAIDVIVGSTTERVKWTEGWERSGLWQGVSFQHSKGRTAELVVPLDPAPTSYRLGVEVSAPYGGAKVAASINGRALGAKEVGFEWQTLELEVPRGVLSRGDNRLRFELTFPDETKEPLLRWHALNVAPAPSAQ